MSLIATASGSANVPLLAEGTYAATCYLLADIGSQYNENFKNPSHKVVIGWEVAGEYVEINGEPTPRTVYNTYTLSLNEKSKLRKDLIPWRGRDFTPEELRAFNLRSIVGAPCFLQIIHREVNGQKYANIAAIMTLPRGMGKPECQLSPIIYDIEDDRPEKADELPKWITEKVKASEEYKMRTLPADGDAPVIHEIEDDGELPF